jgi:iron(III) transport system ATP-binding protein
VQHGTPEDLYSRPATLFAARFFSDITALPGTGGDGFLDTRLGRFAAPGLVPGKRATACVRPQHLRLVSSRDGIEGHVVGTEYRGDCRHVLVAVEGIEMPLTVCVETDALGGDLLGPGATVHLAADTAAVPVVAGDDIPRLGPAQGRTSNLEQVS